MTSSQNEATPVSTRLFGGIEWLYFGHHQHEYRTLALHCGDPLSSDDVYDLRQIGLGISGIRNVTRTGNSNTCVLVAFRDMDISDADMATKANELLSQAERQRPRLAVFSGMAVNSDVDPHGYR